MTNRFSAMFDRLVPKAIGSVGLSDPAEYTPATGGVPIPCTVLVDRSVEYVGQESKLLQMGTLITCFAHDVGQRPARGARFVIGTELFTVDELDTRTDESRYVCIVKEGP